MISNGQSSEPDELTIADVALNYPQSIKILNRYHIDYCFEGNKPFFSTCRSMNLDGAQIWTEINKELPIPGFGRRFEFRKWNTGVLIDFILQNHHEYIRVTVPEIKSLLDIICSVHGDQPQLQEIRSNFETLTDELVSHMPEEETVLFPAIRRVTSSPLTLDNAVLIKRIQSLVADMHREHHRAGELLREIRELSDNFQTPAYACPTFQMAYRMLEEFEQDIIQHMHLENNVLFPKVMLSKHGLHAN